MENYNNDLLLLPNGLWFIRAEVLNNENILNKPVFANTGGILIASDSPTGAKQFIFYPWVNTYPTYYWSGGHASPSEVGGWVTRIQSNPNLIDNPFFTINQRGFSNITIDNHSVFTIDRWQVFNTGAATLNDDGSITLDSVGYTREINLGQHFEPQRVVEQLSGKQITISFDSETLEGTDVDLYVGYVGPDDSWHPLKSAFNRTSGRHITTATFTFPALSLSDVKVAECALYVNNAKAKIYSVKMEVGRLSTLAMDTAPNYSEELLKCQRYFVRKQGSSASIGPLYCWAVNCIRVYFPLAITMRTTPTITTNMDRVDRIGNTQDLVPMKSTVTSIRLQDNLVSGLINSVNANAFSVREICAAITGTTSNGDTTYFDISADA